MKAFLQALQQSLQSMLIVDIRRVIAMCQTNVVVARELGGGQSVLAYLVEAP